MRTLFLYPRNNSVSVCYLRRHAYFFSKRRLIRLHLREIFLMSVIISLDEEILRKLFLYPRNNPAVLSFNYERPVYEVIFPALHPPFPE